MALARTTLHDVAERITELFLRTELTLDGEVEIHIWPASSRPDLELALESLEADVGKQIRRLLEIYREKIRNIDEYILHPGLKDLHLVRTCILWVPAEDRTP
jgi:hypothetical protein